MNFIIVLTTAIAAASASRFQGAPSSPARGNVPREPYVLQQAPERRVDAVPPVVRAPAAPAIAARTVAAPVAAPAPLAYSATPAIASSQVTYGAAGAAPAPRGYGAAPAEAPLPYAAPDPPAGSSWQASGIFSTGPVAFPS